MCQRCGDVGNLGRRINRTAEAGTVVEQVNLRRPDVPPVTIGGLLSIHDSEFESAWVEKL